MKLKVVSNGEYFRIKGKLLFWWIDPGFPVYDSFEKAQDIVDRYSDGGYKDCDSEKEVSK